MVKCGDKAWYGVDNIIVYNLLGHGRKGYPKTAWL